MKTSSPDTSSGQELSSAGSRGELLPGSPGPAAGPLGHAPGGRRRALALALLLVGSIVCVSSLLCLVLLPSFVSDQISKRLVLRNNSLLLERWSKPNVPMQFRVWLFNVTNAPEVQSGGQAKPRLAELGPFVFELRRVKDVVQIAGDHLYYTERKIYHFNASASCCPINTTLTVPNIPLVAVVERAQSYAHLPLLSRFIPRLVNRAVQSLREQLFVQRQVRELLFEGYDVELLKLVARAGALVGLPATQQRFAILHGRNNTWRPDADGVWAINTGARERRRFGQVASWNAYTKLPFWAADACNAINGSDGTLFAPPISRHRPLYIFNQELCRTVRLAYARPSQVRSIDSLRFELEASNFARTMAGHAGALPAPGPAAPPSAQADGPVTQAASGPPRRRSSGPPPAAAAQTASMLEQVRRTMDAAPPTPLNPHSCFCDRKSTRLNGANVCELDGLIELSKCSKQAQAVFGSMPHFYQADGRLLQQVAGLQPNATRHTTYLDIEPNTGLVLGGKRRVQLNLLVKRNHDIEGFERIRDMLLPVIWFEESAQIPEESARKFRAMYTERVRALNAILASLFLASLGVLVLDARLLLSGRVEATSGPAAAAAAAAGGQLHEQQVSAASTGAAAAAARPLLEAPAPLKAPK